jgi:hypothetical protein
MSRLEHPRRQFAGIQRPAHQVEAAHAVAQVQVDDAGLAAHQAGHMRLGGEPQQFVEGRLAGTVVADRQFADADQGSMRAMSRARCRSAWPAARGSRRNSPMPTGPARAMHRHARAVRAVLRATSSVPSRPITVVTPRVV